MKIVVVVNVIQSILFIFECTRAKTLHCTANTQELQELHLLKKNTFSQTMSTTNEPRLVFISASFLVKFYTKIPPKQMEESIFFFGSKRSWVFPSNKQEEAESKMQPTDYMAFPITFRNLIKAKEQKGLVYWLKPDCDFQKVSQFFQNIVDPVTQQNYKPLQLDNTWWTSTFKQGKYTSHGKRVVSNYLQGEHDYTSIMELLYQSNPTMQPVLSL